MATKIRLARGGAKKRPFYRVVAADSRAPRDGAFIEKLGTYNPLLPKDSAERFQVNADRIKYWISKGAQPSDGIKRFLVAQGLIEESKKDKALREKSIAIVEAKRAEEEAKKKAEEEAAAAEAAAQEAEQAAAEAPAEEAAEEAKAEEAPAEEEKPAE